MGRAKDLNAHWKLRRDMSVPAGMVRVRRGGLSVHPLTLRSMANPDVHFDPDVLRRRSDGDYPARDATHPARYLFLMRHAAHKSGTLTDEARAHVEGVADRLREWADAEWRDRPERTIVVRTATTAPEVSATALQLARQAGYPAPRP